MAALQQQILAGPRRRMQPRLLCVTTSVLLFIVVVLTATSGSSLFPIRSADAADATTPQCNLEPTLNGTVLPRFSNCTTPSLEGSAFAWTYNNASLRAFYSCKVAEPYGWCGWGISSDGKMIGSSAVIGYTNSTTGASKVEAFYLGGKNPSLVTKGGVLADIKESSIVVLDSGNEISMTFTVSLPESALQPYILIATGDGVISYSEGLLEGHEDEDTAVLQLSLKEADSGKKGAWSLTRQLLSTNVLASLLSSVAIAFLSM